MIPVPLAGDLGGSLAWGARDHANNVPRDICEMADEVMELAASAVSDASFTPTDSDYERSQALSVIRAHHQYYVAQGIMYVTCYSSSCHFVLLCM